MVTKKRMLCRILQSDSDFHLDVHGVVILVPQAPMLVFMIKICQNLYEITCG